MAEEKKYPKIDLYYYNMEGRAEAIRLTLYIAGIPFNDHRLNGE
jgi:hypothetical protein